MKRPVRRCGRLVVDRLKGKVPRLKVIAADHGYKVSFIDYVQEKGWRVEIARGAPHKSRKVLGALYRKRIVVPSNAVSDGLISGDGCFER